MGITDTIVRKVIEKVAVGLVPKEGKLEDGTREGRAAKEFDREQGVEKAREIERRERADRTA